MLPGTVGVAPDGGRRCGRRNVSRALPGCGQDVDRVVPPHGGPASRHTLYVDGWYEDDADFMPVWGARELYLDGDRTHGRMDDLVVLVDMRTGAARAPTRELRQVRPHDEDGGRRMTVDESLSAALVALDATAARGSPRRGPAPARPRRTASCHRRPHAGPSGAGPQGAKRAAGTTYFAYMARPPTVPATVHHLPSRLSSARRNSSRHCPQTAIGPWSRSGSPLECGLRS